MTYNGSATGSKDGTLPSTGDTGNKDRWKNNHNNKEKKFVGDSKSTEMKGKVVTQDGGNKSFNETRDALATFVNKKCPSLAYNIKEMITLTKDEIVQTKLDYSGCKTTDDSGAITWDNEKKVEIHDMWKYDHQDEMIEWRTYNTTAAMAINEFEYQVEHAVLIEAKKNKNYKLAHTNKDVILLLETIQNVVNKGEYGGKRDSVVTNLDLTRFFLTWQQQDMDVPTYTKTSKQKYESLVANVGNMPFGETEMLVILQAYKNNNNSNNRSVATMKDYYNGDLDQQKEWNDTYMDVHLSRKVIMGSTNRDVQKDLDKGVRLGNTYYPNELEKATGLILQYDKEKERELLRRKKYNHNKNNNSNKNNDNNIDGDDGKNDDKTETVGVVINEDNSRMQHILALINAGYDTDEVGEMMTEEEFNNEISEEEYNNEEEQCLKDYEAALRGGPVG